MNGKIKKIIFLIIIISIISIISCKTEKDSINVISDDLKPIIVLIERDPWLMVIGSDSPTFALYSDGTLIYFNKGKGYFSIKLNKNKLQEYIPDESFKKLDNSYFSASSTDQPINIILYFENDDIFSVSVYGDLRSKDDARKLTPDTFLNVYDKLIETKNIKGTIWIPDYIEVMIWPYEYSPEEPMKWPSNWPDINNIMTRKRGNDSYSIYLDSKYYNDFVKLLRSMKEKQAILINNKKWAVSYRFPFPCEDIWMR